MSPRRPVTALVALLCAALLSGCVAGSASAPSDPRSGAGLRYGLAPAANQGTDFTKNVVLVGGGAANVRSVTADGLTWTLAPDAPGIGDLRLGRIMFLTDRAVGRVVAVHTTSKGVDVTLAPVPITDVIEKGDFSGKDIPLKNPVALSAEGAFWADPDLQQQAGVDRDSALGLPQPAALLHSGTPTLPSIPRPPATPPVVKDVIKAVTGGFSTTASCCDSGPGASFTYAKDRLKMNGQVALDMDKPTVEFRLKISGASIAIARIQLSGAAGIQTALHAKVTPGPAENGVSQPLLVTSAFSVPVGEFFGVPLALVINQGLTLTVYVPGTATFDGAAKIKLGGTIGFHYSGGQSSRIIGTKFEKSASLTATNSIAVGISWAKFVYSLRMTVGFGIAGFVAGLYGELAITTLAVVGAPVGFNELPGADSPIEHCVGVQVDVQFRYGIGYSIPEFVQKVVNFFLEAFNSTPIKQADGVQIGWQDVLHDSAVFPQSGFCVAK